MLRCCSFCTGRAFFARSCILFPPSNFPQSLVFATTPSLPHGANSIVRGFRHAGLAAHTLPRLFTLLANSFRVRWGAAPYLLPIYTWQCWPSWQLLRSGMPAFSSVTVPLAPLLPNRTGVVPVGLRVALCASPCPLALSATAFDSATMLGYVSGLARTYTRALRFFWTSRYRLLRLTHGPPSCFCSAYPSVAVAHTQHCSTWGGCHFTLAGGTSHASRLWHHGFRSRCGAYLCDPCLATA